MKSIFYNLINELSKGSPLALATILNVKGSAPQVSGSSAIFSVDGLVTGTLGGGILEGDATQKAITLLKKGKSTLYDFGLNSDIDSEEGAICGGSATLLIDAHTDKSRNVFSELDQSIQNNKPGVLITVVSGKNEVEIERFWREQAHFNVEQLPEELRQFENELFSCLDKKNCQYLKLSQSKSVFLQPIYPLSKLIIAGAGHIGKALAYMADLLDFEVTIIDDRSEYANRENIPVADTILVKPIGKAMEEIPKTRDTYIVIVTRGHRDDSDALRACIHSDVPYIGMIGSKKKVKLTRENFISHGWATATQFDRIHSPVGLEIGSKTIQEIAVSISAQLIQVRSQENASIKENYISAIILAAGESRRMGKPKMLLPFGDTSIIAKLANSAILSRIDKTIVVLGSDHVEISKQIQDYPLETVYNEAYKEGMLSSVQAGLSNLNDKTEAIMVLLGDQPMIGSNIMNKLIETYRTSWKEIIVATYKGKRGHPILFGSKYKSVVMELSKENSLKDLLLAYPEDIAEMETDSPEILRDIDTEKDYKEELKQQINYD